MEALPLVAQGRERALRDQVWMHWKGLGSRGRGLMGGLRWAAPKSCWEAC